eukprot:3912076-Alexandrium_andersonii.AAC.1
MDQTAAPRAAPAPDTVAAPGRTNLNASVSESESENGSVKEYNVSQRWTCDACHRMSSQRDRFKAAGGQFPRWGIVRMSDTVGRCGNYEGPLDEQDRA